MAQVEPLPLVPPTVMTGHARRTPRRPSTSPTRSRPSAMAAGCCASIWRSQSSSDLRTGSPRRCGYDRDRAPHLRGEPVLRSLDDWLRYIEAQHPAAIALGLDRVSEVLGRLCAALACPVITVGGTNGKGTRARRKGGQ